MPLLSLTSWSLHRCLGPLRWNEWDSQSQQITVRTEPQPEELTLLQLPQELARRGFESMEVCHFHFPSTDSDYLASLREACSTAGIRFYTLLVDYGDVSSADVVRRNADLEFIKGWIDIASRVGAERVRVIAGDGDAANQDAIRRADEALALLVTYARARGVRIITENFHRLASTSQNCLHLVEQADDEVGLTADFGNFKGQDKYDELARIIPRAESVHAKAHYDEHGMPDGDEFIRCLDIMQASHYDGPVTLVYDGPGDMWEGIERIRKIAEPYIA